MLVSILLFAVGLVLLIKGGDWFVDGATGIAKRFNLPDIVVGATVVSIGTTLPEVMVSTTGALAGSGAMAYGNAIGCHVKGITLEAKFLAAVVERHCDECIGCLGFHLNGVACDCCKMICKFYSLVRETVGQCTGGDCELLWQDKCAVAYRHSHWGRGKVNSAVGISAAAPPANNAFALACAFSASSVP